MKSNGNAQALGPRGPVSPRAVAPYIGGSSRLWEFGFTV